MFFSELFEWRVAREGGEGKALRPSVRPSGSDRHWQMGSSNRNSNSAVNEVTFKDLIS